MSESSFRGDSLPPFPEGTAGALLDGHGRISAWTPEAAALLGRSAAEVVGLPARLLLADPAAWTALTEAYARGAGGGEAVLRSGRGEDVPVVFRAFALDGGDAGSGGARGTAGGAAQGGGSAGGGAGCLVLATTASLAARWHQDQAFVTELFLQDRVGLAVFDPELRLLRTNTHLLPYTGVPSDLSGRRLSDFLWPGDAAAVEEKLREVLRTGRPLIRAEELLRTVEDPGGGVVIAITAFRLQAPDGQVLGVTGLFTDETELRRSSERLALLHHATARVGGSLSVRDTGRELAAALVPGLCDLAVVEIADAVSLGEEPAPGGDGRPALRRTAVAGRPATGGGSDADDVDAALDAGADAGGGTAADAGGYPMTMSAPLCARGTVLGRVSVGRHAARGPYEQADRELLREIADRAALALDNARRFTRERRAAVGLQRSMLPPTQTETVGATTSGVYLPADTTTGVGGDWFDVIPLSSARVAFVVGDVVGHGLAATATMGRLRTAVRTLADLDLEPDELLAHLDDLVAQLLAEPEETDREDRESGGGRQDGEGPAGDGGDGAVGREEDEDWGARHASSPTGATCVYAVYDPVTLRCVVASAGHPPPAVVDPEGRVSYLPVDPGPPLGVGGLPFESTETDLAPGSLFALYTDGLVEGHDGDLDEGMARLAAHLGRPGVLERPLRELGREIVAGRPADGLADDVALLLARTRAVPAEDTAFWTIDADPAAVGTVREAATARLHAWGLDDLVFTTELVLSELVTNAVRYAGGPIEVRLIRAGRLICEVSDPSATHPRMRRARLTDEGGRGLYLVAQLTTRWGSRYSRSGKTIWAEQEFPSPEA
ncbi:SpoIIE family protein phosphatase [Streptomyces roseoviridis]|uniref:SpoIIE family protein phosphatase n=1 Tax=Streptomyces roseoviridis TaxID=67361 RepID=A0ABV5QX67_9ACTN